MTTGTQWLRDIFTHCGPMGTFPEVLSVHQGFAHSSFLGECERRQLFLPDQTSSTLQWLGTSSFRAMPPKASLGAQNPCVNTSPALALSKGCREPCEITLLLIPATLASLELCNFILIAWSPWALCMPLVTCGPSQRSKLSCLLKTAAKVPPSQADWQRQ